MTEPPPRPWRAAAMVTLIYLVAIGLTRAAFFGDTIDYAIEVGRFDGRVWDFGHLLWVPLNWLLAQALLPLLSPFTGGDSRGGILWILVGVNAVAGLASVLLLWWTARRWTGRDTPAVAAAAALVFSHAFLSTGQTGSAYVPGLALLLLALSVLTPRCADEPQPWWAGLVAGTAFSGAVCLWFPYVLVAPALLLMPLLLHGKRGVGLMLTTGLVSALVGILCFGLAVLTMGIDSVAGLRRWVADSSHGFQFGGTPRMIFGLARSFIDMGQDGLLFKRFLLADSYNPVSLLDLVRLSLWKIVLFYLMLTCLLFGLLATKRGRLVLTLLLCAAGPVIGFGVFWQGGDMERYLPLYPFMFLALAVVLVGGGWASWLRWVPAAFFVGVMVVNVLGLSLLEVAAQQRRLEERVADLRPLLKPGSRIVVVRDDLMRLPRDFAFEPANRRLAIVEGLTLGSIVTPHWRQTFAASVRETWADGGDVWLSKWLLQPRPHPQSTWVEGDDARVSWAEVVEFFSAFETEAAVGGDDGFVRLAPSEANQQRLEQFNPDLPVGFDENRNWFTIPDESRHGRFGSQRERPVMWNPKPDHPLCRLFSGLTEQTFITTLGVADPHLIDYLSNLLSRFIHFDAIYRLRNTQGRRLEEVAEMMLEAEALPPEGRTKREVHRHIGDFTLFWTGVYPEALERLRWALNKDRLIDYQEQGKRSYYIASTYEQEPYQAEAPVLRRLSSEFELFAYGLRQVRHEWERNSGDTRPQLLG